MWQDLVLAAVGFAFGFTLIPQVLDSIKRKRYVNYYTAFFTILGLSIIAIVHVTLNLWFSALSIVITCSMWFVLLIYSLGNKNESTIISSSDRD